MIGRNFILAGKAIFTVSNGKGEHYTFKVKHKEGSNQYAPAWFVSLLTGPNNEADYTYLGMLDAETGEVRLTKASKYNNDSTPVKVVRWAFNLTWNNKSFPDGYAVDHCGYCGRCGRTLTVPSSIESGFGPECVKIMCKAV